MNALQLSVRSVGDHLDVAVIRDGRSFDGSAPLPGFNVADAAALRWLLEDLPRLASESARSAGVLAQAQLSHFGQRLFDAVREPFQAASAGLALDDLALQIDDPQGLARHLPWELMNDGEVPLALRCGAFTRIVPRPAAPNPAARPARSAGPLRLLLVVARPAGRDDVAFRSVASRVLAAAAESSAEPAASPAIEVEVLRPATFAALRKRLRAAWKAGRPYDIVHFDGHGAQQADDNGTQRTALVFEPDGVQLDGWVDAGTLAPLLAAVGVSLLVLNACHAAAEALPAGSAESPGLARSGAAMSFAEEIASAGGVEVVAMSHAIHVATAALVVQDLYACLQRGFDVASAATFARRRWRNGAVAHSPGLGFCLLRHAGSPGGLVRPGAWPEHAGLPRWGDRTPAHPDLPAVFASQAPLVAADDTLLLLERALAAAPVVQFNGLRGAGKTTLLLEMGRWLVASKAVAPQHLRHLDLAEVSDAAEAVAVLTGPPGSVLLIDGGERIEGDPLRAVPGWSETEVRGWRTALESATASGLRVIVAARAPLAVLADAPRVLVPRMAPADLRSLAELQADEGSQPLPEAAIRWAGGHPGVLALLAERARAGGFADPAMTLTTLSDLSLGVPPRDADAMMDLFRPLLLVDLRALFESQAGALLPWLLMQFHGQVHLTPLLWQLAETIGLKGLAAAASHGEVEPLLERLEKAGLSCRLDEKNLLLHPMLPFLVPQPCNSDSLRQQAHWTTLRYAIALYVRSMQVLHAGLLQANERRPEALASTWDLGDLLHAFTCTTDSGAMEHPAALVFARRLRERLLALDPALWPPVFDKLCAAFEKVPPPPDNGVFNPNNVFRLLRMEEAQRNGDTATAQILADEARSAAAELPGGILEPIDGRAGPDMSQVNRYDTMIKTGRALAERDPAAARAAFEAALDAAGQDVLRRAKARLELTRLLRKSGRGEDLEAARAHGELALAEFIGLARARLTDRSDVSLTAMSLSNVYRDLANRTKPPDPELAARGEALCQASLDNATNDGERATARINLAGWRRDAGDPTAAASHFLEAANLYERLGNQRLLATALAYRAECLLDAGDALQARVDGVRATSLLVELPDKPRDLIRFAYETAERALARLKAEEGGEGPAG